MSYFEEKLIKQYSGLRIILVSITMGLVGALPLMLYIIFGPVDGNPVGLGLLAALALPVATIGLLVGVIKILFQYLKNKK